jgi:hypothetical protein
MYTYRVNNTRVLMGQGFRVPRIKVLRNREYSFRLEMSDAGDR